MKHAILFAAAALLGSSVAAFAAQQTNGIVQGVNAGRGLLRLQSGEVFSFDNPAVLYGLLPGQHVGVVHDGGHGINAFDPHPATRSGTDVD